ncbi:hypothetical protein DPMN_057310 [Dreissena polymorpha]|uniref:Uncharacterized protein n=1 Tax=Dreissena polymorpha TaxID=45954 RepID=A0A9D4BZY1_DREPO|nr:hypothetical protein DPMN_057310 [Dreissena polymorpha]
MTVNLLRATQHTFGLRLLTVHDSWGRRRFNRRASTEHSGNAMAWIHHHRPKVGQYPGYRWDTTSVNGYYLEQRVIQCV